MTKINIVQSFRLGSRLGRASVRKLNFDCKNSQKKIFALTLVTSQEQLRINKQTRHICEELFAEACNNSNQISI